MLLSKDLAKQLYKSRDIKKKTANIEPETEKVKARKSAMDSCEKEAKTIVDFFVKETSVTAASLAIKQLAAEMSKLIAATGVGIGAAGVTGSAAATAFASATTSTNTTLAQLQAKPLNKIE